MELPDTSIHSSLGAATSSHSERDGTAEASRWTQAKAQRIDLSGQGLTEFPSLASPSDVHGLNLSGNVLTRFPARQILEMSSLQDISLTVSRGGGPLPRRSPDAFRELGCQMTYVAQGNRNAKVAFVPASANSQHKAFFTTDLDPCLSLMIFQRNKAIMVHIDTTSRDGIGATTLTDALRRHLDRDAGESQVHLIGCNAQGSASNLRGTLRALEEFGLTDSIVTASIGNGHTSAVMDLRERNAYVGFG